MKQFYETYRDDEFVSTLLTQISWSNHLAIMSKSKTKEERDFYVALAAKEHYSSRELERQLESAYYERYMLSSGKQPPELVPQTVLYRAEGDPEVTGEATFLDIDEDAYYAKAVVWGQQNGIIKGYSETEYAPEQDILREQIAAIMHRFIEANK